MAQNWYYARGNQQLGPISLEELKGLIAAGQVQPADLVWSEGMAQWTAARAVAELMPSPAPAPIAPAPIPAPPPPAPGPHASVPFPGSAAPNPVGAAPFPNPQMAGAPPWPASPQGPGMLGYQTPNYPQVEMYGGFWMRFAAYIIDYIITYVGGLIVGFVIGFALALVLRSGRDAMEAGRALGGLAGFILAWLYYALMESSPHQATLGKLAVGLKVTDMNGGRIGFGQATGRFFGKIISGLILCIGFMMAGWTERRQALHDMMANTLVVKTRP